MPPGGPPLRRLNTLDLAANSASSTSSFSPSTLATGGKPLLGAARGSVSPSLGPSSTGRFADREGAAGGSAPSHSSSGGGGAYAESPTSYTAPAGESAFPLPFPSTSGAFRRDPTFPSSSSSSMNPPGGTVASAAGAGTSPTSTHTNLVARRRDTGSPAASTGSPVVGGSSSSGAYIGGGFSSSSSTSGGRRRNSLTVGAALGRRWWMSRGRGTKLAILLLGALGVWWLLGGIRGEVKERKKLAHRWWEADETPAEDLAALLPRPTLPPRPPRPKPPPSSPSHTLSQLLKLPSAVSPCSADYTAVVHLSSSSHLSASHLSPLLTSLSRQSAPPSRILLLVPSGLEPPSSVIAPFGALVSTFSYPPQEPPVLALAHLAQSVASDHLLFVDGNLPSAGSSGDGQLPKDYAKVLLHASGTGAYSASVLTAGGLSLSPSVGPASGGKCIYPSLRSPLSDRTSQPIHLPSLPFLLSTSWLLPTTPGKPSTSILQGLNTHQPLEIALSAALWTKHAIPVFALPIPLPSASVADAAGVDGWACERLRRFVLTAPSVGALFAPASAAGEGIRRLQAAGDARKGGLNPQARVGQKTYIEEADEARSRLLQGGTVVLLLSGREELEAVRAVACRFAAGVGSAAAANGDDDDDEDRLRTDLKVVVADYDLHESAREEARSSFSSFSPSCHLELTPLGASPPPSSSSSAQTTAEPVSLALVDLLDTLDPAPAFVLYLTDGPRAREFEEVLRWMGGVFGVRKGGERWARVKAERELLKGVGESKGRGRPTVVGMRSAEVRKAEWVGALELEALRHWHVPRIDLSVVTNDRPVSLHRLVSSLQTAYYYGDDVALSLNLEQTTDRLTHRLVDDLRWPHGTYSLRHRILLGGLMPAIVESWYPTSNDTYGVLLEDDVEVSPLFYGWLKFTILQYRYTRAGRKASSRMFGVSLYQQKNIELRPEGRQPFDAHRLFTDLSLYPTSPYLSQIPCSWGAAYFPEVWREFHTYLSLRLSELALPISEPLVPAIRSNRWPRSWKKYFIELVYLRGYAMLYPNYPAFESLSTNHLEKGTHVHTSQVEEKKKALFEVPLLDGDASLVDSLPGGSGRERLPEWEALPVMDLWGALASAEELLERGWQTTRMLGSCPALPDLTAPPRHDARELLCRRIWDRETEGRLIDAQPLRGPERAEQDAGRAAAAEAEQRAEVGEGGIDVEGDGVGEVEHEEILREPAGGIGERAFGLEPAPAAQAARGLSPALARAAYADEADEGAHFARPQHDHLHEDASIHEVELDDADAGKRGQLFEDAGANDEEHELRGAGGGARRRWRKAVDLEAREQLEEESEWGIDENEEADLVAEPLEQPEKAERKVRWARAD
ncbi:hypothetical protein JCM10213_000654 [Rhodosporidiobolus nylandii]